MPVKKSATAKKATAKKSAAKSAAPALAKKVAAKKTASKKSASASSDDDKFAELGGAIVKHIENGNLDGHLQKIDAALSVRIAKHTKSGSKKTAPTKKVTDPPKRNAKKETAVEKPKKDETYRIKSTNKKIGGMRVKFLRKKTGDATKVVVEAVDAKPGYPKGKQFIVPLAALVTK